MRLRAAPGAGDPSVGGVTIKPDGRGIYNVNTAIGAHLVESFGFIDVDAAPKQTPVPAPAASPVLRDAVIAGLKTIGVAIPGNAADGLLATALTKVIHEEGDRVAGLVKATEDRVISQFADEQTALKARAEKAEARVAELEAAQKAAQAAPGEKPAAETPGKKA